MVFVFPDNFSYDATIRFIFLDYQMNDLKIKLDALLSDSLISLEEHEKLTTVLSMVDTLEMMLIAGSDDPWQYRILKIERIVRPNGRVDYFADNCWGSTLLFAINTAIALQNRSEHA